jgi:hypothetical protein
LRGSPLAQRPLGRFLYFSLRPTESFGKPGPGWAVLCGAIASGQLTLRFEHLLLSLLLIFFADAVLGTFWELTVGVDWLGPFRHPCSPPPPQVQAGDQGKPLSPRKSVHLSLPYTLRGSPSYRLANRLGLLHSWWRENFWPVLGSTWLTWLSTLGLGLLLAFWLGGQFLALSLLGLAVTLVAGLLRLYSGGTVQGLQASLEIGTSWLLGNAAFAAIGWPSLALAFSFTAVYYAGLILGTGGQTRALRLLNGAQLAIVLLLLALRRPLEAAVLGLLLMPQLLLQLWLAQGSPATWYLERTRSLIIIGMVVAALAVR